MSQTESQLPADQNDKPRQDVGYLILVAALVLLIMGTLTFLWVRERGQRQRAEDALRDAQAALAQADKQAQAMQLINSFNTGNTIRAVSREDLPSQTINISGKDRHVFTIGRAAGERFGFRGGDVVIIAGEPATATTDAELKLPATK
ncbi:MAG: hypothetical protein EHM48_04555 [Planctomycetaceae bacterium]|nr:MAG: hypothetical protein EHM48_04555 [Planctomycetaceae bacterium]